MRDVRKRRMVTFKCSTEVLAPKRGVVSGQLTKRSERKSSGTSGAAALATHLQQQQRRTSGSTQDAAERHSAAPCGAERAHATQNNTENDAVCNPGVPLYRNEAYERRTSEDLHRLAHVFVDG